MNAFRTVLCVVGLVAATLAGRLTAGQSDKVVEDKPVKKGRGKFTIGKETTYITEALDKDGYPDYARALNQRLRQGVTPENNANVLLWKALGPHPEGATMPSEFFQWLGIQPPPDKGEYFVDLKEYMKQHLKIDPQSKDAQKIYDQLDRVFHFAWSAKEHPEIARWLETNEKPLALVVEATKRPQYFSPSVPPKSDKGPSGLITVLLPGPQKSRWLAQAIAARAMLRLGQGKFDDAWQDLLACHRLGRHVGRGATLIEALVGLAIDGIAGVGDISFLNVIKDDTKRLQGCLADLQTLPALPVIADKVNLAERLVFLDSVMKADRYGVAYFESLAGKPAKESSPFRNFVGDLMLQGIDWDPALRDINQWIHRIVSIAREKNRRFRAKEWEKLNADLKAIKEKLDSGELSEAIVETKADPATRGKIIGDLLILFTTPAVQRLSDSADRLKQVQDNLCVGFALAWYHCDHGHYPKTLEALAPKYLKQIPQDIFSGKPLIYRPSEKGFLLYSVGMNGKDDGGQGYGDTPRGDDLVVRIPGFPLDHPILLGKCEGKRGYFPFHQLSLGATKSATYSCGLHQSRDRKGAKLIGTATVTEGS